MDAITTAILEPADVEGHVAEFGCFKGGLTAKLSLACEFVGKRLLVFDSFDGLPEPEPRDAEHQIERPRTFKPGEYSGTWKRSARTLTAMGASSSARLFPAGSTRRFGISARRLRSPSSTWTWRYRRVRSSCDCCRSSCRAASCSCMTPPDAKLQDVFRDEELLAGASSISTRRASD
jgi:hypothetical protein